DVERVFRTVMRKNAITTAQHLALPVEYRRLELLQQFEQPEAEPLPGEPLLDDEELGVFVEAYERSGSTGGINWYRNLTRNWEASEGLEQVVRVPSLMVGGEDDIVLAPALTNGMEAYVPDLEKHVIPGCGHWTQHEKPDELNAIMIDWLGRFP